MKKTVWVIIVIGFLMFLFGFVGCEKSSSASLKNKINFSSYSQSERQTYVLKALEKKYGETFEISEVSQRQVDVFHSEDDFFATARCSARNYTVHVWVDMYGNITDTGFMLELNDEIDKLYDGLLRNTLHDYKVSVYTEFTEKPNRIWTREDNLMEMLSTQSVDSDIRIFINQNQIVDDNILNEMAQKLDFSDGTIYIYECDDPEQVNLQSYDLLSYKYKKSVERK